MTKTLLAGAASFALAMGFVQPAFAAPDAAQAPAAASASGKPQLGHWGFDTAGMDTGTSAGDDFYKFANGKWDAATPIPADRSSWGGFGVLRDLSDQRMRSIAEEFARGQNAAGSSGQKVGDYYASFMDEAAIDAKGATPLKGHFDRIDAIRTPADLARYIGDANRDGITVPVGAQVEQDLKDNSRYTVYIGQGGLGLPDRDYYLIDSNPKFVEARAKYQAHVANMLRLAGVADADAKAKRIYELEKKIAATHWTQVESRQIEKLYNPVAMADFARRMPGFDWAAYYTAAGVAAQPQIVVAQPSAVTGTAKLLGSEPLSAWKDYLTFHTIAAAAPVLSKPFVDESFAFNGKVLNGTPQLKERSKRAVDLLNAALGEAVGELYVTRYFPPDAKAKADELVRNITAAMDLRLQGLSWMTPETKAKARTKLAAFTPRIGYPDRFRDYAALQVVRGDAFGNAMRATRFEYQRNLNKLGKPIDKGEWQMFPQTVNAYANPLKNEIVFPAAILQPPFFDPNADPAVNYGGIGAVIGHEISHHFDDQGRKFDPNGNLADWWSEEDIKAFKVYTDAIVKQYGEYEPLPGSKVNGELTLGENIADLAGLTIAYEAYKLSLGGKEAPVIDGFTGDQRFFLGFAQVWRNKYRDPLMQQILTADPHTPGNWRPYVVRNLDAWYAAFDVKPGSKFYLTPEQRLKVW